MSIAIICKDIDLNINHSLLVTRSEAEEIVKIDPNADSTLSLPSTRSRIDTHADGTSDIWGPAAGGQSHWSVRTNVLIQAVEEKLDDE